MLLNVVFHPNPRDSALLCCGVGGRSAQKVPPVISNTQSELHMAVWREGQAAQLKPRVRRLRAECCAYNAD